MAGAELRVLLPSDSSPLEKAARAVLSAVPDAVWSRSEDGFLLQARFSADIGESLNELLRRLVEAGVGTHTRSAISVWPSSLRLGGGGLNGGSVTYTGNNHGSGIAASISPTAATISSAEVPKNCANAEHDGEIEEGSPSGWHEFLGSAAERLAMARAVQAAEADARLSFDFVCLLVIAAFLAALGLVENSTEILVASMLISPLMGPIMAFTLGTLARERRLQRRGVRVELLGLAGCLLLGFLFGLAAAGVSGGVPPLWPTREMSARGKLHAVWVGALVALLSGAAVALATLGGYTASLVGVAISAALLPPAVNAGLLWSLACVTLLPVATNSVLTQEEDEFSPLVVKESRDILPSDLALQGGLSVCLTLLNIICIFLAAVVVLKVKQVSPWSEERLLRPQIQRWVGEEPHSPSPVQHRFWPSAHPSLTRRSSLLLPQPVAASYLLTGYDNGTRTWSPGAGAARPSLNELRSFYRWTHGPATIATADSTQTQCPTASSVTVLSTTQSPPSAAGHDQIPPSSQSPSPPDCRSPGRKLLSSAITLPTIREARLSPSPPKPTTRQTVTVAPVAPRFIVTPTLHDPLLDAT